MMKRAMKAAQEKASKSAETLKVFVAPEFFWRGGNAAGGIPQQLALRICQELAQEAAMEEYQSWLFIFGTVVVVGQDPNSAGGPQNFAPVVAGGPSGARFICTKKNISQVDFMNFQGHYYDPMTEYLGQCLAQSGWQIADDGFIAAKNVRMCVEICLDHKMQLGKNHIKQESWSDFPSIHIVTSCWMSLQEPIDAEDKIANHCPIEFLQDGYWRGPAPSMLKVNG